jgi:hypothetical protein
MGFFLCVPNPVFGPQLTWLEKANFLCENEKIINS